MKNLFAKLLPFLFLGMMLVLLAVGLVLLSWLLIWGAVIGVVLFVIAFIREKLSPSRRMTRSDQSHTRSGRTIDHEDK